ncbi:MAG: bifunctional diaminohydroxyphosphoribosylaminopyrimidine deaminase/5-amino-6-(5-phosphoribosylamino)uracil reductase RibD [candidate division KSB1 bacterium]|nr:bifunctional diaminohydroxyphosphoribosylaminopyrimidine deaminase/5-amino-6-(5-phosphoribosylamino)uracil reductase RibD [candidate division KSB1 bacterium]MDZ7336198.1 bifunctional diaminohydroxyphosphoribosylaminopyrimidine deaminase/5-amino-6-(5-phosphoribosylamino)uracil reductase RibD [candidate division KSB1 bacterium]MDZ7356935.1 bifunctional diaminohydroxyphosphoribosylaminopyrimidine deaminase/5-amino-6-(5-phosphoribosylamino)uracil reductase RibD [candidate division KSB1 bacterium]
MGLKVIGIDREDSPVIEHKKILNEGDYLKRAIRLARRGMGHVSPNPMVGCVIVNNDAIVGEGYHRYFGGPHAEVEALQAAGEAAAGATLYVNLEPCCHYGKTPPCTDAIIRAGIKRVVVGMIDPNPLVNQRGIEILRQHGIEVTSGVEEEACRELNRCFIKYIVAGLPYVTMKIAQSLDGRIATATGHSQWITSYPARVLAHRLRAEHDAVIVGIGTVLADDPQLTVRFVKGTNPWRIVLDDQLRIPLSSRLLTGELAARTIVATTSQDEMRKKAVEATGAQVWTISPNQSNRVSIPELLKKMASAHISSALIEGGSQVNTAFLKAGMVDRIIIAIAPRIIGAGIEAIGDLGIERVDRCIELTNIRLKAVGPDYVVTADLLYPNPQ